MSNIQQLDHTQYFTPKQKKELRELSARLHAVSASFQWALIDLRKENPALARRLVPEEHDFLNLEDVIMHVLYEDLQKRGEKAPQEVLDKMREILMDELCGRR